jgi:uncharacterized protein (DUF4213/DUF364 family)
MQLNQILYQHFESAAAAATIETISIGLGYTAVTTTDGGIGVAYTYFDSKQSCHFAPDFRSCEGDTGLNLLENIRSDKPLHRSVALAAINAFNHPAAVELPEDTKNIALFDRLGIRPGKRIAMVGYFGPLIKKIEARGAVLEILDASRRLGRKKDFYSQLSDWADILLLTSTSILNDTCEDILSRAGKQLKTVMLGPSTPMVAAAFEHLPVHLLAGTVPLEKDPVLKAVRHGQGTPVIQRFSRKVCLEIPRRASAKQP